MSTKAIEISKMVDILPADEQELAYEFIKRIVLAWDPDFTKSTPAEQRMMEEAEAGLERGEYYTHDQINWD